MNTCRAFIELLFIVNWKPTKWRGIELEAGETIRSLDSLAEGSPLTIRNWRTSIEKLKMTGELTERKHGKHRILKVTNYTKYQQSDTEADKKMTGKRQGTDRELTGDKEGKKERKKEGKSGKIKSPTPKQQAEDFFTNDSTQEKLIDYYVGLHNVSRKDVREEIDKFVNYWTELNKSGTKQLWETKPTFEVQRRLTTWFGNIDKFGSKKSKPSKPTFFTS